MSLAVASSTIVFLCTLLRQLVGQYSVFLLKLYKYFKVSFLGAKRDSHRQLLLIILYFQDYRSLLLLKINNIIFGNLICEYFCCSRTFVNFHLVLQNMYIFLHLRTIRGMKKNNVQFFEDIRFKAPYKNSLKQHNRVIKQT